MASPFTSTKQPLIYSVVAHGTTVLAEHALTTGNFKPLVTNTILDRIASTPGEADENTKLSFTYDKYFFHYYVHNGLVFLVMADHSFGKRIPFAYLFEVCKKFEEKYGKEKTFLHTYEASEFEGTMAELMEYYSNNPSADKFRSLQSQLDEVKSVMVKNIESVLERGEHISILVDKTDALNSASLEFRHRSTGLRRAMYWKNMKWTVLAVLVGIVCVYLLVGAGCGFPLWGQCLGSGSP